MIYPVLRAWAMLLLVLAVSACGNALIKPVSETVSQVGSTTSVGSDTSTTTTTTAALSNQSSTVTLPSIDGFTGTLVFPAASTTSVQIATVSRNSLRTAQNLSTGSTFYYAFSIVSPVTITLPSLPAITLCSQSSFPSNELAYVSVTEPSAAAAIATIGPATVTGNTLQFSSEPKPITLRAGVSYTFTIYGVASQSNSLIYAANSGDNSITAYDRLANGDAAPLRRIAGSSTGLDSPVAIQVSSAGVVWVLNATQPLTMTVYDPGATGNVAPMRRFTLSNTSNRPYFFQSGAVFALSSDGSTFAVASNFKAFNPPAPHMYPTSDSLAAVQTYSTATGKLLRAFYPVGANGCYDDTGGVLNNSSPCDGTNGIPIGTARGLGFASDGDIGVEYFIGLSGSSFFEQADLYPSNTVSVNTTDFKTGTALVDAAIGYDLFSETWTYRGSMSAATSANQPIDYPLNAGTSTGVYVDSCAFCRYYGRMTGQVIIGSNTLILGSEPSGVALAANGTVVTSDFTGIISVFAPGTNGNVSPTRQIVGPHTKLNDVSSIAIFEPPNVTF